MTGLEAIAKKWVDTNGNVRWYVNDWYKYVGVRKGRVTRRNVFGSPRGSSVVYETKIQGSHREWSYAMFYYKDYIENTKVWIDERGKVHVKIHPLCEFDRRMIESDVECYATHHPESNLTNLTLGILSKENIERAVQDVAYCYI